MPKWWEYVWLIYRCFTDGGRDGLSWPALSGHWLSCTRCWLYLLSMKRLYETLFLYISTFKGCFCSRTIFTKKGIDNFPRISCVGVLHTILRIFSRGVPGLANDSLAVFGAVDGPLASCMMVHFRSTCRLNFLMIIWCESLLWWRGIFLLISCLYSCLIHNPSFTIILSFQFALLTTRCFILRTLYWYFTFMQSLLFLIQLSE